MKQESIKAYSLKISQASRSQLIVIMYDMALEYLDDAESALSKNDKEEFHKNLKQIKRIVDSLISSLDMKYDISAQLYKVYMTMGRMLIRVSVSCEKDTLNTIRNMLTKLRKSFDEVSKTDTSKPLIENSQKVYAGLTYSSSGNSNEFFGEDPSGRGFTV